MLAVLAFVATSAEAQFVRGVVRDGTGSPVAGAVVELSGGSDRVVRALSREDGRYRLAAPGAGSYRIRVLRIGFRTGQLQPIEIPAGGTLIHDLLAPMVPVRLDDVQIRAEKRCVVRPEEGMQAAALWEEARKALFATDLVQKTEEHRARIRYIERGYDRRGQHVTSEKTREFEALIGTNPFSAIDPNDLAEHGYIRPDTSGGHNEIIYYAPDAHVLVDDAFTSTHCFTVEDRERRDEGLIGLRFEPVEGREVPDVYGTLWLDRRTSELRSLEYKYTDMERGPARDRSGGRVEFKRLASGAWIVERWWIRMPVYVMTTREREGILPGGFTMHRESQTKRLASFREEGAEVISTTALEDADPVAAIGGRVIDHTLEQPLVGAEVVALESNRRAMTGENGAFRIDSLPEGPQTLVFSHPRSDSLGLTSEHYRVIARAGELSVARLGIPARVLADRNACPDSTSRGALGTIAGAVRDLSSELAIAGVTVVLEHESDSLRAATDSTGSFLFCGVPRTGEITLRAERGETVWDRHALPTPRNRLTVYEIVVRLLR